MKFQKMFGLILLLFITMLSSYGCTFSKNTVTYRLNSKQNIYCIDRVKNRSRVIPTLYFHGWGASARSTNSMIAYAQKSGVAKKVLTATVNHSGKIVLRGTWSKEVRHPLIQVIFTDNKNSDYLQTSNWVRQLLLLLKQKYRIKKYNIVAHSMGNLTVMYYQVRYGKSENLPKLNKQVNIAGHFDGIIGIDDYPNRNYLLKSGCPKHLNNEYRYLERYRQNYPHGVYVLNIFGNKEDGTNSDGDVTVVSARSLGYLLRNMDCSYREVEIKGKNAQHSKLHENPQVARIVDNFLW